jgi:four helix bundle protein
LWIGLLTGGFGTGRAQFLRVPSKADELKERCERFAAAVVRFARELPQTMEAQKIAAQLIAAATSVAANYRGACRARSHAEFVAKIGIVVEESDEASYWLGLLVRVGIVKEADIEHLSAESEELVAIFVASHKTASARRATKKSR